MTSQRYWESLRRTHPRRAAVYTLYGHDLECLYVGRSADPFRRVASHVGHTYREMVGHATIEWVPPAPTSASAKPS